jgi:hypothetical protein
LVGALVAISTGLKETAMLGVPEEVERRLLECYDGLMVEDIAEFWGRHFLGRGWRNRLAA